MNQRHPKRFSLPSSLVLTSVTALLGFSSVASAQDSYYIENVRVFTGTHVIASTNVLTEGDSITGIGTNLEAPSGATIIDGSDKTLYPGLIDAHAHTFWPHELQEALMFGVTTELGMFDSAALLAYQACTAPATDRADLLGATELATAPGGHGTQFGIPVTPLSATSQVPGFVDTRIAEGAHHIKIVLEDLSLFQATPVSSLNLDLLQALVQTTHDRGLLAVSHVTKLADAEMAVENNVDGLVHIPLDAVATAQFVRLANRKDAFVAPTLAVMHGADGGNIGIEPRADANLSPWITPLMDTQLDATFSPDFADRWAFQVALESTQVLNEHEVPLLAGSDCGNPTTIHGATMHREMELLVYAGLTPVQALTAATSNAAKHFRLKDRGYIRPGKLADMVLVNGDPTTDILATRDIAAIFRRGALVNRAQVHAYLNTIPLPPALPPGPPACP